MNLSHKPISQAFAKDQGTLAHSVRNYYRCPDEFLDFRLNEGLSADQGFFQFGPGTTCYGRSLTAAHQTQLKYPLSDLLPSVLVDGGQLVLPFDPDEVIGNLRLERYASVRLHRYEFVFKKIYYWLRPVTNRSLRSYIQKRWAANGEKRQFPKWPVDTTVEYLRKPLAAIAASPRRRSYPIHMVLA